MIRIKIVTYTGKEFDYENINIENIDIEDIFTSLPRLNRFVGHSIRACSVGEHTLYCLLMARKLNYSKREQILILIHDFSEAYMNDCPTPLKDKLPEFKKIEQKVELAIFDKLDIEPPTKDEKRRVKKIDLTMLAIEMRDLTLHKHERLLSEDIYTDILDDDDFNLSKSEINEHEVRKSLRYVFEELLKNFNKEV